MEASSDGWGAATAFDRLITYADPPTFNLNFCPPELTEIDESTLPLCFSYDPDAERDVIADLPEVDAVVAGIFRGLTAARPSEPDRTRPGVAIVIREDGIPSFDGRQLLVEGRWYDPSSDEIVINEQFQDLMGIEVGEEVTVTFWAPLAVGTFAAAASLTASLDSLRATPDRFGAPWDVSFGGAESADDAEALKLVRDHPGVAAAGMLVGTDVTIGDQTVWVHAFEAFPGVDARIQPPITSGRGPGRRRRDRARQHHPGRSRAVAG